MIISYSISNFKSIKYKETISLKAKQYKSKIKLNNNLVPIIALYGPNGGGKSSLIESLNFLLLLFQININKQQLTQFFFQLNLLKFCKNKEDATEWELQILNSNKNIYEYKLSIKNEIEFESLYYKESENSNKLTLIFEKTKNEIKLGKSFNGLKLKEIPYGSMVSYLNSNIENKFITDFWNELSKFLVINNLKNEPTIWAINLFKNSILYNLNKTALINEKEKIIKIFKEIDINIIDYDFRKDINGSDRFILTKNSGDDNFELEFANESEGTKKIIQLISYFIKGIHNGSIFVIDELDSRLHTKLLGYIIDLFHSKENKNSQIIFTSHDMNTLSPKYLRKDEVYFVALNESYFTNIICLSNFEDVREKSSFSKKYLDGEFGYDPYILRGVKWDSDDKK